MSSSEEESLGRSYAGLSGAYRVAKLCLYTCPLPHFFGAVSGHCMSFGCLTTLNQTRAVWRPTLQQVNMPTRVFLMSKRPLSGHSFFADQFGFALPPIAVGLLWWGLQAGAGDHRLAASRVELSLDISRRMSYLLSLIGFCGLACSLARH
jgi:hypothetical protein